METTEFLMKERKKEMRKEGKGRQIGKERRKGEIERNIKLGRTKRT
jgi:hypothetical protein